MPRLVFTLCVCLLTLIATPHARAEESAPPAHADRITRHTFTDPSSGVATDYLLYHPDGDPAPAARSLVIYLYGSGGSLKGYNIQREPYAQLRAELAKRGYFILVAGLGRSHFMNDAAKAALDGVVAQALAEQQIPADRVHVMGTSMGGGSSLAYAIHRKDMIRSVCAVMPMTDFARWIVENPKYAPPVTAAYGGTPEERPDAYDRNSAVKQIDAFAHIPVMLIHGDSDRTVLPAHSTRLAEALHAKDYTCVLRLVGGLHKDAIVEPFQVEIADFFDAATSDH